MKINGWIVSTRSSNNTFRVEFAARDDSAFRLEVTLSPEDWAKMVTAMPVECDAVMRGIETIGHRRVRHTVTVPADLKGTGALDAFCKAAVGWNGTDPIDVHHEDFGNHHKYVDGHYRVNVTVWTKEQA